VDDKTGNDFTEITILPDGRMYVFGLTRPVLELLAQLPLQDDQWRNLHDHLCRIADTMPAQLQGDDS
jgi:hypothetical protein